MLIKKCAHKTHNDSVKNRLTIAITKMREAGLRITEPRKEMLSVILLAKQPLSSDEVFAKIKGGSTNLATVFRSLSILEDAGILSRHDLGDEIRRYEVNEESSHHHHFIRCRSCGNVEAFDGCAFSEELMKSLKRKGYKKIQHKFEVKALCANCSK